MNLLYIGKYPPLEGGTSATAYWRLLELSRAGHTVTVITACPEGNCIYSHDAAAELPGIRVIIINDLPPWHIPFSELFTERLSAAALDASLANKFDLVEGCYLAPFGVAAWLVSKELGIPLILRHAGSDFRRLFATCGLMSLWRIILRDVYRLVTYPDCYHDWITTNLLEREKIVLAARYVPPPVFENQTFLCRREQHMVFAGKITAKWHVRGFDSLVDFLRANKNIRLMTCYTGGDGLDEFRRFWSETCKEVALDIRPFVPPNRMPGILKEYSTVFCGGNPHSLQEAPNTLLEAVISGCSVLIGSDKLPVATPSWATIHSRCLRENDKGTIHDTPAQQPSVLLKDAYEKDYRQYVRENEAIYGVTCQQVHL